MHTLHTRTHIQACVCMRRQVLHRHTHRHTNIHKHAAPLDSGALSHRHFSPGLPQETDAAMFTGSPETFTGRSERLAPPPSHLLLKLQMPLPHSLFFFQSVVGLFQTSLHQQSPLFICPGQQLAEALLPYQSKSGVDRKWGNRQRWAGRGEGVSDEQASEHSEECKPGPGA